VRFDRFDEGPEATATVPDGANECEIVKVRTVLPKAGGERLVIEFLPTAGIYDSFEKWLNPDEREDHKAAMQLLECLGLPRDTDVNDGLVGKKVEVITKAGMSKKTGLPLVYVNGFSAVQKWDTPNDLPRPKASSPKPAKITKGDSDDIPF
jgi:hypothetical protein